MGFNQVAEALGHPVRRRILVELVDHNPVADNGVRESEASDVQLIHTHLPKLDSTGYIVWNRDAETIIKGPSWEEIEPVVRLLRDNRERLPNDTF